MMLLRTGAAVQSITVLRNGFFTKEANMEELISRFGPHVEASRLLRGCVRAGNVRRVFEQRSLRRIHLGSGF